MTRPYRPTLWTRFMVLLGARSDYYLTHPMPPLEPFWPRMALRFAWYDLWVGAYVDTAKRTLYVCPLPCILLTIKSRNGSYPKEGSSE